MATAAAAVGDGGRGGAIARLDGGPELGEKGRGVEGILVRPLPWAEVERGGGSAVAGGARWIWWAVAALGAREEAVRRWRRLWSSEARREAYL